MNGNRDARQAAGSLRLALRRRLRPWVPPILWILWRSGAHRRGFHCLSRLVLWASAAHLVCVCLVVLVFRFIGERCWAVWPFLFLPPHLAFLPLALLTPLAVLTAWRALPVQAVAVATILFPYMGWRWSLPTGAAAEKTLVVLTAGMGQRNRAPLEPFIAAENPDVIVFQDFPNRIVPYARQYPGWHAAAHGEFAILSRHPINASGVFDKALWGTDPVAAWFELDWDGTAVVFYNVHLPSPRRDLRRLKGLGFLKEWARSRGWFGRDPRESVSYLLKQRNDLARVLAAELHAEERALIVAGDLNMPSWGYTLGCIVGSLLDAFEERGRGFGYTFPGTTGSPLSLYGSWLRLDYVLCNRRMKPVRAVVEPPSRAQHRAVVAHLALVPG